MENFQSIPSDRLMDHCVSNPIPTADEDFVSRQIRSQQTKNGNRYDHFEDDEEGDVSAKYVARSASLRIGSMTLHNLPLTRAQKSVLEEISEQCPFHAYITHLIIDSENKIELEECQLLSLRVPVNDTTMRTMVFCRLNSDTLHIEEEDIGEFYVYLITNTAQTPRQWKCLRALLNAQATDDDNRPIVYRRRVTELSEALHKVVVYFTGDVDALL